MASPSELKLKVPWGHISALSWGPPSAKPVLLVHGTLDNAGSFTRLVSHLPQDFHYVSIDLPSHGFSSHFPPGMFLDFFNFVVTIHYVLEELNWKKCLYIGHSFGAQLGVMFSILSPNRLEKIIALDALFSKTFGPDELPTRTKTIFDTTISSTQERAPSLHTQEKILETLQTGRQFALTREAAEALFVRATTRVGDKYRYNRDVRMRAIVILSFNLEQLMAYMKKLVIPVLLIIPEHSWYKHWGELETLETIKKHLSGCVTVVGVPGNHDVHNNEPEVIAPHVVGFFNDQKSKL
ncbi:serine hydrolase-like protein 2 [Diachasma alloeum]|uniref:serine hydrolase-like protein 2 n=1 Tax=Diachasma alloeum TaxID=454923 RepID=UPI000738173B|nr:serine hydrolase-like protein 2 [Diachasma alloeum]